MDTKETFENLMIEIHVFFTEKIRLYYPSKLYICFVVAMVDRFFFFLKPYCYCEIMTIDNIVSERDDLALLLRCSLYVIMTFLFYMLTGIRD